MRRTTSRRQPFSCMACHGHLCKGTRSGIHWHAGGDARQPCCAANERPSARAPVPHHTYGIGDVADGLRSFTVPRNSHVPIWSAGNTRVVLLCIRETGALTEHYSLLYGLCCQRRIMMAAALLSQAASGRRAGGHRYRTCQTECVPAAASRLRLRRRCRTQASIVHDIRATLIG
jgi:hypothetical protein